VALAAIGDALACCGYTVEGLAGIDEAGSSHGVAAHYPVTPGPSWLRIVADGDDEDEDEDKDEDKGSITITVEGPRFGRACRGQDRDPVAWMMVLSTIVHLSETYAIQWRIADPERPSPAGR